MKKIIISLLMMLSVGMLSGCTNTNTVDLESQIATLKADVDELKQKNKVLEEENTKLNDSLEVYAKAEEEAEAKEAEVKAEKSKYTPVAIGDTIAVDGYGEFTIKSAEITQKVIPPNASGFYTYYEVKDPNEIYLDVVMEFKNTTTIGIRTDEITNMKVYYDTGYEYSSFSTLEESGGSNFTYTNINKVEPLKSVVLHYIATLPKEVKDSTKELKSRFKVYDSNYEVVIR